MYALVGGRGGNGNVLSLSSAFAHHRWYAPTPIPPPTSAHHRLTQRQWCLSFDKGFVRYPAPARDFTGLHLQRSRQSRRFCARSSLSKLSTLFKSTPDPHIGRMSLVRGEARIISRLTIPTFVMYSHGVMEFGYMRPCYRL